MARKKNRLIAVALLAVLAIASLSIGNALWSETITVGGSAATGTLSVDFGVPTASETDPLNVGTCTISNVSADHFDVAIGNAYPDYSCTITYTVINNGTIPVAAPTVGLGSSSGSMPPSYFSAVPPAPVGLAAGTSASGTVTFAVPHGEIGNENGSLTATINLLYTQGNP